MAVVQEYKTMNGSVCSVVIGNSQYLSQTFQTTDAYTIYAVRLPLAYIMDGTITVEIQETTSFKPNGSVVATATVDASNFYAWPDYPAEIEDENWADINFDSPALLSETTVYAIVLTSDTDYPGDWMFDDAGSYSDGSYNQSTDQGTSWTTVTARDFLFETHDAAIGDDEETGPVRRLIPFIYSASIAYICEFGDQYIRFYYDDAVLLDGSSDEVWIETPYENDHLFELQFKQIGDTMWILHPGYAPRKLTRTSATSFSLDEIEYKYGPFLTRNDLLNLDVKSAATMAYSGGSLACSGEIFESGHVGAIFKLIHPRPVTTVSLEGAGYSDPITGEGTYNFITRGTWTGTITIQKNDHETGWATFREYKSSTDAEQNISLSFDEEDQEVQYRLYGDVSASFRGELSTDNYLQESIVKITAVTDSQNATAYPIIPVPSTDATKRWAEGAWSDVRTYPVSITFYDDRCVLAGQRVIQEQVLTKVEEAE